MTLRFRTRTFLISFVPVAVLMAASFWTIHGFVQLAVRNSLRTSLAKNQLAMGTIHAKGELQNSRFLKIAGENSSLKAGVQLLVSTPGNEAARNTVEDQLRELGEHMGFDFLLVSSAEGKPMAAVIRKADGVAGSQLVPVSGANLAQVSAGLVTLDGRVFQVGAVPVEMNGDTLGSLAVGETLDFGAFTGPVVLMEGGRVVRSTVPGVSLTELDQALQVCGAKPECDLQLRGASWISLAFTSGGIGGRYAVRVLENADAAAAPVLSVLNRLFLSVAIVSGLLALFCSLASSRSIVKPLSAVITHLHDAAKTGELPEFDLGGTNITEIRELAESYNWAAASVRRAQESLRGAYVEFVGSLANALDARDPYTAGHSRRVSQLSCSTAAAMGLCEDEIERIRIGALLHDIGKIGVADAVLQKAGRLTDEEFDAVKKHPVIGRRILEGVCGFLPFLAAVELHHENWDGSGYPHGEKGEQTAIEARIIHVSDAYDAMTTDRSYRRGMTHERALCLLEENAGTQFDPRVVEVFIGLPREAMQAGTIAVDEPSVSADMELV